jgi:hypothetical protein
MLDDRVGIALAADATVGFLDTTGPMAPSWRKVNELRFGLVVLEGRGGGVRRPWERSWWCGVVVIEGIRAWFATSAGLIPSATPDASRS